MRGPSCLFLAARVIRSRRMGHAKIVGLTAWVVWWNVSAMPVVPDRPPVDLWNRGESAATKSECEVLREKDVRLHHSQIIRDEELDTLLGGELGKRTTVKTPDGSVNIFEWGIVTWRYQCWPDTADPRRPRASNARRPPN